MNGLRIVEDIYLTEPYVDWSRCRSPSRAARRLKQGHPQRVRHLQRPRKDALMVGGVLYMHPETAKELRRLVAEQPPATKPVLAPRYDPIPGLFFNLSPLRSPILSIIPTA